MRILRAEIHDFRNIREAEIRPSPRFTALIGPNGQGKTNLLEAIYLVAALRPLRSVQRRALIRSGREEARVRLAVERRSTGLTHDLEVHLQARSRVLLKDGKQTDAASFLGVAVGVAFTPDDLSLPKGGPEARRRFLDRALLDLRPAYLSRAMRYQRALKERNRLLADNGPDSVLDSFDQIVASEGSAMMVARAHYTEEISERVQNEFDRIAAPAPKLGLTYHSVLGEGLDPSSESETKNRFLERLAVKRGDDRRRKATSTGPHLDDLLLTLDGQPVRERASQGQHRALVLALKLAEIAHLEERLGEPPILLLDDMSSELDRDRSRQLFAEIRGREGQVILTSTEDPWSLGPTEAITAYDVRDGSLTLRTNADHS
jgi:DNA replication and repair protein RecF